MIDNDNFSQTLEALASFWHRHLYCLPKGCIEKGIRLFSTSSKDFRKKASPFLLTKILNAFCLFESACKSETNLNSASIRFRLLRTHQRNHSLGVVAVLKISSSQLFSQKQLLLAIRHLLPGMICSPGFDYQYRDEKNQMLFIYQEFEKQRGRGIVSSDIQQLKEQLAQKIDENIVFYVPSLLWVHNEEEVFRNLVRMGKELIHPNDIPQVTISFQEYSARERLRFSVAILRVIKKEDFGGKLAGDLPSGVHCFHEAVSQIGYIQQIFIKQANLLTCEVDGELFAGKNGAIDLRKARGYVGKTLESLIGEFRDYNGGLFSKQDEQLKEIHAGHRLSPFGDFDSLFYAFTPSLFQAFLLPEAGRAYASLFHEAEAWKIPNSQSFALFNSDEDNFSLALIKTTKEELKNAILQEASEFFFPAYQFGYAVHFVQGVYYLGFIYQQPADAKWFAKVEARLQEWEEGEPSAQKSKNSLRLNFQDGDPLSLNPHMGLDLRCRSIQKALFEGLTRLGPEGGILPAAAEKWEISSDGKRYLFYLRKIEWSNGERVTAHQFENTWKAAIQLNHLRPDLMYVLRNAKQFRLGKLNIEEVGVKALDHDTLQVLLEYPAPYFLHMLSLPLFFPLYQVNAEPCVFNGPFTLRRWTRDASLKLIKNPYYWDLKNTKLDEIEIAIIRDPELALELYEEGKLDWVGGPFSPFPTSSISKSFDRLQSVDTPGVCWIYCNLHHPLLASAKIRRALSFSLDRQKICQEGVHSKSLYTQLPTSLSLLDFEVDCPIEDPVALFEKGLEEIGQSRKAFADLVLCHSHISGQQELAKAVLSQWKQVFDIDIQCIEKTWNVLSHQLDNREIHFGLCYRHPFYPDPMYFFQIFSDSNNIHNAFGWSSCDFNRFIDVANQSSQELRIAQLKLAEMELWREMPVIPLHMVSYDYLANPEIEGIRLSCSGDVDFKWVKTCLKK